MYAVIFNFYRLIFKVKEDRVCFVSMHNENFNDCLGGVYKELKKLGKHEFVFINREDLQVSIKNLPKLIGFFLIKSKQLATSNYVFLNDNFLPMGNLNFDEKVQVCQLWHGEGAFKKFGLSIKQDSFTREMEIKANAKLTSVICTSTSAAKIYAEAFGVAEEKVHVLGSARVDYFYDEKNAVKAKQKLSELYPQTKGKTVVLYAPTFRDDPSKNEELLSNFDFEKFQNELGETHVLLVKLHPQVPAKLTQLHGAVNVSDYDDVRELVLSCDMLITDYSSIAMDFSLVNKKAIYFAFDLSDYIKDRNFYFDYESFVSGEVARDTVEVIECVKKDFCEVKNDRFKRFNFDFDDDQNAKRIIEFVFG